MFMWITKVLKRITEAHARKAFPFNNKGFALNEGETHEQGFARLEGELAAAGDYKAGLPDDIKNHPSLKDLKTPADVATSWVNAQKLIGRDKIPVPPENATEEDWNEVYSRLGRPEKADGYQLPDDIQVPDGMPVDSNLITAFKEQSHKLGLVPKQVEGLFRWFMGSSSDQFNALTKTTETNANEAITKLKREWGAAYDTKLGLAMKVFQQYSDDETFKLFDTGLGNNPGFLKLFATIGELLSEDQLAGKPKGLTLTPEEAQAEIDKIKNDLKGPLYDASHPEHNAMVEKVKGLYEAASIA